MILFVCSYVDHKPVLCASISQEILIEYFTFTFSTCGETAQSHSTRIKIGFHLNKTFFVFFLSLVLFAAALKI